MEKAIQYQIKNGAVFEKFWRKELGDSHIPQSMVLSTNSNVA
jgi:hypothetical protein